MSGETAGIHVSTTLIKVTNSHSCIHSECCVLCSLSRTQIVSSPPLYCSSAQNEIHDTLVSNLLIQDLVHLDIKEDNVIMS